MSYTALYRKFRPGEFEEVKGQDHIVTTLQNQMMADRLGHAYLFCGTRGTGKTTVAKIFAKAVNCEQPINGSPCGTCNMCKNIAAGTSLNVIEIDAASNNGVDNIRGIREEVEYRPAEGKYKVYIIDEVHMLSIGAFNALLKTLEEPPSYVIFILATTEMHKIPITILSRCQHYSFKRITIDTIADRLRSLMEREEIEVEEKALRYIAKVADGSMRDALSLLDQCIAFYLGKTLTYENVLEVLGAVDTDMFSRLLRQVIERDVVGVLTTIEELVMQGRELTQLINDFTWYQRNLLLVKSSDNIEGVLDVSSESLAKLKEEAEMLDVNTLLRHIRVLSELSNQMRYATQKRVLLEVALIKLCEPEMETNYDSVLERIRKMEQQLEKGLPVQTVYQTIEGSPVEGMRKAEKKPTIRVDAIPEEVQAVAKDFGAIKAQAPEPAREYLKNAMASLGEQKQLLIVVENSFKADALKRTQEDLQAWIEARIDRKVPMEIRSAEKGQMMEDSFVDIAKLIGMEIEVEDDI